MVAMAQAGEAMAEAGATVQGHAGMVEALRGVAAAEGMAPDSAWGDAAIRVVAVMAQGCWVKVGEVAMAQVALAKEAAVAATLPNG